MHVLTGADIWHTVVGEAEFETPLEEKVVLKTVRYFALFIVKGSEFGSRKYRHKGRQIFLKRFLPLSLLYGVRRLYFCVFILVVIVIKLRLGSLIPFPFPLFSGMVSIS